MLGQPAQNKENNHASLRPRKATANDDRKCYIYFAEKEPVSPTNMHISVIIGISVFLNNFNLVIKFGKISTI